MRPRFGFDPLLGLILLAVLLALLLPAQGQFASFFAGATSLAVGLLFFFYGARLSPQEAFSGLKHWKLHGLILTFTYLVFPLLGLALFPLKFFLGPELYTGILFLCLLPSTVQSSIAFTALARGNVAGAMVSASLSNMLGVFLTPVLVMLLLGGRQLGFSTQVFTDIALQLLLPFVLGQLLRRWFAGFARHAVSKQLDRVSIAMVVYSAFSAGVLAGVWRQVQWWQLLVLVLLSLLLVEALLKLSNFTAQKLGFSAQDRIAIQFCASKKSLASGLPIASVIFGPAALGLLVLPLLIFHQVQLMVCAVRAARLARQS